MKLKFTLLPVSLVAAFAAYIAFHPGVSYAEPRMAGGAPTSLAQDATYNVDPMHASIYFEITHLELSKVMGRFNKFEGTIRENEKDLTKSSVEFSADIESIDTGVAPRDAHLRTADFFDAAKYPKLTFRSTKITKSRDGYVVTGDLTIKDKTKQIAIPFKHFGPYTMKGAGDQPARIGVVAAPIELKRSDFGVGSTAPLPDGREGASDKVIVRISFEGIKAK